MPIHGLQVDIKTQEQKIAVLGYFKLIERSGREGGIPALHICSVAAGLEQIQTQCPQVGASLIEMTLELVDNLVAEIVKNPKITEVEMLNAINRELNNSILKRQQSNQQN